MAIPCPQEFLDFAVELATEAGPIIRKHFRTPVSVDTKPDATPVSIADRDAEKVMRQLISDHYPDHGIYGEEFGIDKIDAEFVWVLDPIDGTKAYLSGKPEFGTLIALLQDGVPIIGVIDQPVNGERWLGAKGKPTTFNGAEVSTRACTDIEFATLNATSPDMFEESDNLRFSALSQQTSMTLYGGDCYAYGLLANGHLDLIVEADLKPYDFCALIPVITGAGGAATDWQGKELNLKSDGRIVAVGDATILPQVTSILSE
ncbi:MAG: histidinol-phosphatase [Rhodospirillaceae bacterium]|nr:histidinol-phosphatase [Rhodospirillaceae bacterium]|tara:strand:- start:118485 stop:119264 length:780 start_codon:yes stop_codon:yes gene_type:complete